LTELSELILALYRAARETPADEFQELALALIRAQTNFRTAVWGAGEMQGGQLLVRGIHLHNEPVEMLTEWMSINHSDTLIEEVIACSGHALISHSELRFGAKEQTEVLDYVRRYGHMNNMTITSVSKNCPSGQWLSLYRAGLHDHFDKKDQRVLEQIMPHLIEALEINRMLGQLQTTADSDTRFCGNRAVARKDGTLYHCGEKFTRVLLEIWPAWRGGKLPEALMLKLRPGKMATFDRHAFSVSGIGDLLLLRVEQVSSLSVLSCRELEVANHYGHGLSSKEIALKLSISPATVRNTLGRIYTKLDIDNKTQLTAMLISG
jgi:DNA-binding CsgD family transcriptional regulator